MSSCLFLITLCELISLLGFTFLQYWRSVANDFQSGALEAGLHLNWTLLYCITSIIEVLVGTYAGLLDQISAHRLLPMLDHISHGFVQISLQKSPVVET